MSQPQGGPPPWSGGAPPGPPLQPPQFGGFPTFPARAASGAPISGPPPIGGPPPGAPPFAQRPPPFAGAGGVHPAMPPPLFGAAPPGGVRGSAAPPPLAPPSHPPAAGMAGLSLGGAPGLPPPFQQAPPAGHPPPPPLSAHGPPPRLYPTYSGGAAAAGAPPPIRTSLPPAAHLGPPPPPLFAAGAPPGGGAPPPLAPRPYAGSAAPPPPAYGGAQLQPPSPTARANVQPGSPTANTGARIDPAQIPRPSNAPSSEPAVYETRVGGVAIPPPSANSQFVTRDTGNCSPRYLRLSMHCLPSSPDLLTSSGMPLGVIAQPMALPGEGEEDVPVVDPGPEGPARCAKCRAYMCPFHRWTDGGRAWSCALCGQRNETRREDVCHLGADGSRVDAAERPELSRGSCEYVACEAYSVRPPMVPTYLFLIDCSPAALQSGLTASACDAAKRSLGSLAGGDRARAGIAAYDSSPHFFRLRGPGDTPCALVVADTQEPHCPVPGAGGLVVPLCTHRADLEALLDSLPALFSQPRGGLETCAGAALKACVDTLSGAGGGRLLAFLGAPPMAGWGAPLARAPPAAESEPLKSLCPAEAKPYAALAAAAAEERVCVDLFLAGSAATGDGTSCVAVLGSLARGTGGGVAAYPAFSPALDYGQLANDVRWACSRPQGLEAVARLRVGSGVSVVAYSGSLACRGGPGEGEDVELPALDCDKAFSAQLRLEERRSEGSGEFVVQLAVLLSTPSGARRIRVHTLAVPVVSSLAALFRAADLDAQLALACRGAAAELLRGKLSAPALRERSLSDAVSALHAYRRFCASNSAAGQLILPEALKLLPLHGLGLSKSPGLRPGSATCERALWALQQLCAPAAAAAPSCYPRLFALAELPDLAPGEALRSLPPTGWLSSERLEADGAALVEDGRQVVLHLGPRAPPELVQQLFGDAPCGSAHPLPSLDTPRSRALHALLNAIRKQRGAFMRLRVLRRPDSPASEAAFFSMLVEDRSAAGVSYVEHLCSLHRAIQARFT